ncbi:MAG TPA: ABC transporter ATP-binding protein [Acidimicrobiales bacterium]
MTALSTDPVAGTAAPDGAPLLEVEDLAVVAGGDAKGGEGDERGVPLVEDVAFTLDRGRTLGLVGESGSGKTLIALSVLGLLPTGVRRVRGAVRFGGRDLTTLRPRELRAIRGREVGMVFQDPVGHLDPSFTVGSQLVETIRAHTDLSRGAARARAVELLDRVGVPQPDRRLRDHPHQLSGGMAQRVMIALAIAGEPRLLIADEPTTALDATVQAQILALLRSLQEERGMALLLISHDLAVVAEMADDVAVVYGGQVAERGPVVPVFDRPAHPYTAALLGAQPGGVAPGEPLATIPGSVPPPGDRPGGCRFHPRCPHATDACRTGDPPLAPVGTAGDPGARVSRCLRHPELTLRGVPPIADTVDGDTIDGGTIDGDGGDRAPGPVRVEVTGEPDAGDGTANVTPVVDDTDDTDGGGAAPVLVEVRDLGKDYVVRGGRWPWSKAVRTAVDGVSFRIRAGETLGLVGESGAGKSTVGRLVLGLEAPTRGEVLIDGDDLRAARGTRRRELRRDVQVVFQDPHSSLDPMMTTGAILAEPLEVHTDASRPEIEARVAELLELVGLPPTTAGRLPDTLSGGQRQRVAIARALALRPRLVVCDEPVSALDVSTQAQVVNLLVDLQRELGVAYLFIGHDLAVVRHVSDRVAVMRHGRIVEIGTSEQIHRHPRHAYTRALHDAVLSVDPRRRGGATRPPTTVRNTQEA